MKIQRSFKFAFKNRRAVKKVIIGGLFSIFFFTGFFTFAVAGYLTRLMCDLLEGRDTVLPEWKNLSELVNEGLQPVLILLVYISPLILLSIVALYVDSGILPLVQLILLPVIWALFPIALIHFVTTRSLVRALHLPSKFSYILKNSRQIVVAWSLYLALSLGALIISGLLCLAIAVPLYMTTSGRLGVLAGLLVGGIAICFFTFIVHVVSTHLFAQAYRASTPFEDDVEGSVRSSIVMPPSLKLKK